MHAKCWLVQVPRIAVSKPPNSAPAKRGLASLPGGKAFLGWAPEAVNEQGLGAESRL